MVSLANKYISDTEPWKLGADPGAPGDRAAHRTAGRRRRQDDCSPRFCRTPRRSVRGMLGGAGVWAAQPEIVEVDDLGDEVEGDRGFDVASYPVLTGDYRAQRATWRPPRYRPGHTVAQADTAVHASSTRSWARPGPTGRRSADAASPAARAVGRAGRRGQPVPTAGPAARLRSSTRTPIWTPAGAAPRRTEVAAAMARARAVNVVGVVTVADDLAAAPLGGRRSAVAPGRLGRGRPAPDPGRHPGRRAPAPSSSGWRRPARVVAIGETGLDHYWEAAPARPSRPRPSPGTSTWPSALGKPVMIHDRDAHDDVLDVLASEGAPDTVIFHCFSGDAAMARHLRRPGYLLSFAGPGVFPQRPRPARCRRAVPDRGADGRDRRARSWPRIRIAGRKNEP